MDALAKRLLLGTMLLTACGPGGTTDEPAAEPVLEAVAEPLAFAEEPCPQAQTRVCLENRSAEPVTVAGLRLVEADPAFALVERPALPATLRPDRPLCATVSARSGASGAYRAEVAFDVAELGEPRTVTLEVTDGVTTSGATCPWDAVASDEAAPDLVVVPLSASDGLCPTGEALACVRNRGNGPTRLTGVRLADAATPPAGDPEAPLRDGREAWRLVRVPHLPAEVPARGEVCVTAGFKARAPGTYALDLSLEVEGEAEPWRVPLVGRDANDYARVERLEVPRPPPVDLVLVRDDAPGILEVDWEQQLWLLLDWLATADNDLRVGVVSTDPEADGALVVGPSGGPAWLDLGEPEAPHLVVERMGVPAVDGTPEHGLAMMRRLAEREVLPRPGGFLSFLVFSTGDDASPGSVDDLLWDLTEETVGYHGRERLVVSALTGGEDGCVRGDLLAAPSPRYLEAAMRSGGSHGDLCIEVPFGLVPYGPQQWKRLEFRLAERPRLGTLLVEVRGPDGSVVDSEWMYAFDENALVFSPFSAPQPGDVVEVRYDAACPATP